MLLCECRPRTGAEPSGASAVRARVAGTPSVSLIDGEAALPGAIEGTLGTVNITVYTWMVADGIRFQVGFLVDHLTSLMMTTVSLRASTISSR